MSDVDLTLLPQSRVSFRLGYSHNNMTGPSFTSIHEGTGRPAAPTLEHDHELLPHRSGLENCCREPSSATTNFSITTKETQTRNWLPSRRRSCPVEAPVELGLPIDTANKEPCAVVPPGHQSDRCPRNPDQYHMQRLLQLLAQPADSHFHSHRAGQLAQQLLPADRPGRLLFLQFRRLQHAAWTSLSTV